MKDAINKILLIGILIIFAGMCAIAQTKPAPKDSVVTPKVFTVSEADMVAIGQFVMQTRAVLPNLQATDQASGAAAYALQSQALLIVNFLNKEYEKLHPKTNK